MSAYGWPEHGANADKCYCPQCGKPVRNTDLARFRHLERFHWTPDWEVSK